jgi:hypothetical protein
MRIARAMASGQYSREIQEPCRPQMPTTSALTSPDDLSGPAAGSSHQGGVAQPSGRATLVPERAGTHGESGCIRGRAAGARPGQGTAGRASGRPTSLLTGHPIWLVP